jgi:ligand-binding sensor domain-containing protein
MMMIMQFYLILFLFLLISTTDVYSQIESDLFLEGASVTEITQEGDNIWVSTYGRGIFKYSLKEKKWQNFSTESKNLDNDLFYTIAASKDYVWAGASEGLFIYDIKKNNWRKRKFSQGGEFGNWIRKLKYDLKDDVLWIGRFRNLTHLDVKRQRFTDHDLQQGSDQKTNNIKAIGLDGDSLIYVGTENGVHRYNKKGRIDDKSSWQYFQNKRGAFNNEGESVSVSSFLFEPSQIWYGTDEFVTAQQPKFNVGGIYKNDRRIRWQRISTETGLPANGIYCMARTGNKVWAGVYQFDGKEKKEYGKGLVLIDRVTGKVEQVNLNELDLKTATILSLHFDGNSLWVGSDRGLLRIQIENPLAKWEGVKIAEKKETQQKPQQKQQQSTPTRRRTN